MEKCGVVCILYLVVTLCCFDTRTIIRILLVNISGPVDFLSLTCTNKALSNSYKLNTIYNINEY